jgi:hypothetical protein
MFRILLLSFLTLLAIQVQAATPGDADFQESARVIPQLLLDEGQRAFGALDLRKFLTAINFVAIEHSQWFQIPQADGKSVRSFTAWSREGENRKVTLNDTLWSRTPPEMKSLVALNAYLSVLGYQDQTYSLTFVLWVLTQKNVREILTPPQNRGVIEQAKKAADIRSTENKGSGDLGGPMLKTVLIRNAVEKYSETPSDENREHLYSTVFWMIWNFNVESTWAK